MSIQSSAIHPALSRQGLLAIFSLLAILWFALPGYRDLVDPDEGRYAEIPREMVATGDWLTPRLNGFRYFEKPALQYWLTAISLSLFGETTAAARLPVILLAFLGALWAFYLGRRLFGIEPGLFAFLMLGSGVMYFVIGHLLTLDMAVGVFLFFGIGALLLAQTGRDDPNRVRNWMLAGWAALALATLTKGLIGLVLPGVALVLYTLWQRDWALWRHLHLGKGLVLYLLITAPWFIAVSRANPGFARFFFIHEHFERYTTTVHHRDEPLWFFLPILLVGSLPWIGSALRALLRPGFASRAGASGFDPVRFLWVYIVGTVLFFSAGDSQLPPYIVPVFPALALLAGRQLALRNGLSGDLIGFALTLALFAWAVVAVTGFHDYESPASLLAYRRWLLAATGVLAVGLLAGFVLRRRRPVSVTILALAALLALQIAGWGFQTQRHRSSHALAEAIIARVGRDVPVYNVGTFYHSLPFYLGHTVQLVAYTGELAMGIGQEPEKWIADWETFARRWQAAPRAVAVFDMKTYPTVYRSKMEQLPMKVIYQDVLKIAVAKP